VAPVLDDGPARAVAVAVIGAGRIGSPVVANLVAAGHRVRVFDVRAEVEAGVRALGANWAQSAAAAVGEAEVVLTVLPGSPELDALMTGADTLLDQLPAGCVWIDLTSASPDLAATLAQAARTRSVPYLDAAVGGGVEAAREGALTLYVGGDAQLLDRCRGLLTAIADPQRIRHCGPSGSGYLTKLLINLLWFGQAAVAAEALLLGQAAGLDPARLQQLLAGSPASSVVVDSVLPRLLDGDYLTSFGLERCVEELDSIERLAAASATPFDVSASIARVHREALDEFGPTDGELLAVAYLERRTGRLLRPAG
jgi:3-hydroxyisobutyrate dehydrogenase